ncbi:Hypothetical predicted protein [Paramuricea clavata]|uniref:Uncharacterized protein n=1 Tax=Paramuricea clavata TaxID=317549 RepID=A0A7D9IMN2_PARCT|nr:Hypothetical predicted protein [Paramuricea clavata]
MAAMTSTSTLYFDPDLHPDDTLHAAVERWKLANDDKKPTLDDYDNIRDEWRSKDRVTKLLGIFSSKRLFADWKVAEPDDSKRAKIIIGTAHDKIREEALKNSWDLQQLRKEGMRIESATKGLEELNNENPVNKKGKYSFKNMKKKPEAGKPRSCYYCGQDIKTSVIAHLKSCRARTSKGNFCDAIGHYETVCRKKKAINELKNDSEQKEHQIEDHDHSGVYSINIFRITETPQQQPPHKRRMKTRDFNAQVIINNSLAKELADTGATISVCGREQAQK